MAPELANLCWLTCFGAIFGRVRLQTLTAGIAICDLRLTSSTVNAPGTRKPPPKLVRRSQACRCPQRQQGLQDEQRGTLQWNQEHKMCTTPKTPGVSTRILTKNAMCADPGPASAPEAAGGAR